MNFPGNYGSFPNLQKVPRSFPEDEGHLTLEAHPEA
jgi:hypothetical protein